MLNTKSFLAADFGAGSIKLAEFEVSETGGLRLKQFGIKSLGPEGAQDSKREAVIRKAVEELLTEKGIKAKSVNVCAPGFHVFSKFVKLPAVESGKVSQIIQYEAQQNVPFPLAEVVWDYQILGATPTGELEVLLVAIKSEIVEGLFRVAGDCGLSLQLADASAAALCNAFQYNYGDLEDCTMLLDIGAKTSNLLFFEKGKIFSRGINIGANAITQDFMNETKKPWAQAEEFKIKEGFVSLGGAYEEPESPQQAALSKIARQFMTRLHIQVNQTIQFYRGQQGGSAPQRLFLAGGASIMTYAAQFFAEKLSVPVEYFNPLRNVQIDPAINLEELARVAHSLGEVVGLGLRNLAHCPVELNLMPKSTRRWQAFNQKKPYFIATLFCITLGVFAMGYAFNKLAANKQYEVKQLKEPLEPLQMRANQFKGVLAAKAQMSNETAEVFGWLADRWYWGDCLAELRQVLIKTEQATKQSFGKDTGIWIEELTTLTPDAIVAANDGATAASSGGAPPAATVTPGGAAGAQVPAPGAAPEAMIQAGRRLPEPAAGAGGPAGLNEEQRRRIAEATAAREAEARAARGQPLTPAQLVNPAQLTFGGPQPVATTTTTGLGLSNEISMLRLVCRAVVPVSVEQLPQLPLVFQDQLRKSPWTADDPKFPWPDKSTLGEQRADGTFTFSIIWKLKRPLKL